MKERRFYGGLYGGVAPTGQEEVKSCARHATEVAQATRNGQGRGGKGRGGEGRVDNGSTAIGESKGEIANRAARF